ncbi:DNA polymerase I [Candidatus Blochmanniella floridana]|uniref:DNA polymerase I n=1 Tax=Blochmanniella floridana TaxID=203907 RepID=Q7VRJ4_BLOFL|nr:DNA polymerase I [Candidatus Blochmannia floridanus]
MNSQSTIHNPIILVDGSFYMYRAYHAYPPLTTQNGQPVWVIYGVISMIKSLITRYQPSHMAVIFDVSGKTFRDDLFKQYKSNRIKIPDDLSIQIIPTHKIIKAMGISVLNIPNVEADDVIATLATFYAQLNKTVLISTGDKDMAQIVSSNIILINTMSNIMLNPTEVEKKFGVPPTLIADYLALVGDRADNIPGVPGIGKKTAQIVLNQIGNLNILYQNLNNILQLNIRGRKKIYQALLINKELAFLCYKLATIKIDVPLQESDYKLLIQEINTQDLILLFTQYEFNTWLTDLQSGKWNNTNKYEKKIISTAYTKHANTKIIQNSSYNNLKLNNNSNYIIYNTATLKHWIKQNYHKNHLILNIHSDNSNIFTANILGLCLSLYNIYINQYIYIPISNNIQIPNQYNNKNYLSLKNVLLNLQPILENPAVVKIGQNMKFNYSLLKRHNINLSGKIFDVILEFYILYGTTNYQNIKRFLNKETFNSILNFQQSYDNYNNYIVKEIKNIYQESLYAIQLILAIFDLHQILWPQLYSNDKLKKIFQEIEIPLISILAHIESYGVLIDKTLLCSYSMELNVHLNTLQNQAYQLAGTSFNLDSIKQLQEILYKKQKLPILKKTPSGSPSTNEEVLKKLSHKYPIPKIILKYRSLSKLKSTYTNKLISMVNTESNRIHTSYNQTRTATGRLSSANPNLQNIPNRNHDGRKIRQAFIAPSHSVIVSADYSQIELRIMAHLSRDFKLINDFLSGKDIHTTTASEIFVTSLNLVTNEQRHQAKTINFGLIYGMSAFGLSKQLSVTCYEAQKYVDRYFQRYPGVMQYIQHIKDNVYKYGYVSTLEGRKLYLPNIYSKNLSKKKGAERAAINAPMQGSAADIIKKAMISINYWLKQDDIPVQMIMQVHDELVFEVQNNFIDTAIKQIKKLMEECFILDVPLKVDIGVGKNWEQAH